MKTKRLVVQCILAISLLAFLAGTALAVRPPLLTDDAETIGKGKAELEFNGEYSHNSDGGVTEKETLIESKFTYGIADKMDLALTAPYKFIRVEDDEAFKEDGFSDLSLDLKWRFFEADEWGLAVRPRITFPTGDNDKELGTGKVTYSLFLIATKEAKPWAFHFNIGYLRNEHEGIEESEEDESGDAIRKDLLFASCAAQVEAAEHLQLVADIGIHTNPDKSSNTQPAYILGGLIYEAGEMIDLDLGIKGGLTKSELDYSVSAGIKFKF
jgi:hypothetical protein